MMLWLTRLDVDPIVVGLTVVGIDLSVDPRQTESRSDLCVGCEVMLFSVLEERLLYSLI